MHEPEKANVNWTVAVQSCSFEIQTRALRSEGLLTKLKVNWELPDESCTEFPSRWQVVSLGSAAQATAQAPQQATTPTVTVQATPIQTTNATTISNGESEC